MKLYLLLGSLENEIKEKYRISSVEILLQVDDTEKISVNFLHSEVENKVETVREIFTELIERLKIEGFNYKLSLFYPPNALHITDAVDGPPILSNTTKDCYSLVKENDPS